MRNHPVVLPIILTFLLRLPVTAQPKAEAGTTPASRVREYIAAFNSGDTVTIRNFLEKNFSSEALRRLPVSERVKRSRAMYGDLGTLTLARIEQAGSGAIIAAVTSSRQGALTMTFETEAAPPFRFTGVRIEQGTESAGHPVAPAANERELVEATGTLLDSLIREDLFSGVVLLAKNDSILFERAGGLADRARGIPNTIETRFNIGSICKTFTRIAIYQLEATGALRLTDTIGAFLPDYPNREAASTVTIRHLLDMESGIPDFFGARFDTTDKSALRSLQAYLPLFADMPLDFPPGTAQRYSNGGYLVLGLIIERIARSDYDRYIEDHVFAPAGMCSSGWLEKTDTRRDMARGYTSGTRKQNLGTLPQRGSSAGGGYSTAHDLLRYAMALRRGRLILRDGEGDLGIAGGAPGLNAALEMDSRSGMIIIALSNLDPPSAVQVARQIRSMIPRRD